LAPVLILQQSAREADTGRKGVRRMHESFHDEIWPRRRSSNHVPSPLTQPPSRDRPSVGCRVNTARGPRARACALSRTICFSFDKTQDQKRCRRQWFSIRAAVQNVFHRVVESVPESRTGRCCSSVGGTVFFPKCRGVNLSASRKVLIFRPTNREAFQQSFEMGNRAGFMIRSERAPFR
jgi:hypothetical protein